MKSEISILIVDDDSSISSLLADAFQEQGWLSCSAASGEEALKILLTKQPNLVILDIRLPGMDGLEVCRQIRKHQSVPIIMLSVVNDVPTRIECLELGADDYLTKPFSVGELIARIKTVLRRQQLLLPSPTSFSCSDFTIDFITRKVTTRDSEFSLTPIESDLLKIMIQFKGKTLDYQFLLKNVWGSEYTYEKDYLHVFINRLRNKLEPDPANPRYILNIRGTGYIFVE
ncbi:MAG: response regulator transcription factor [Dehalococcoidales bacterium]|jgi:two-component system KDP operon response regulator KdpE|nr:response regulator transcription factor [Dehalococcoidales bacterium]